VSEEQGLDRSVLERKERDELVTIAEALGVKANSRTKKADLVDKILRAAGYEVPDDAVAEEPTAEAKPRRARRTKAADAETEAGDKVTAGNGDASASSTEEQVAEPKTASADPRAGNGKDDTSASDDPAAGGDDEDEDEDEDEGEGEGDQAPGPNSRDDRGQGGQGGQGGRGQGQGQGQPQGQRGQGQQGGQGGQQRNFDDVGGPGNRRSRRRRGRDRDRDRDLQVQERGSDQTYQGDPIPIVGLLDLTDQGFGFVRVNGYLASNDDVYVSVSQARRFGLRKGDAIEGSARPPLGNEKYGAMLRIDKVSDMTVEEARQRRRFEDLTPLFPDEKIKLEVPGQPGNTTARIVDLICPIGKGQRGLIVSPPKAGKTTVMKHIAASIEANNPEIHLMVLLVDERPEEVTDMRRHLSRGEVWASTFDRPGEEHAMIAELAIEPNGWSRRARTS
jgi:transcription termination factor Rho